jgi:hypothetical protein
MASRHVEGLRFDGGSGGITAKDIMCLDGEAFLRRAYVVLLGRPADPEGLAFYLRRMAERTTKVSVLKQISRSPEGRAYGAKLPGLAAAIRRARLRSAPVIGPVYIWLHGGNAVKRLPPPR